MSWICIYCKEPRNDKSGCCGENHWEEDGQLDTASQTFDPPMTQTEEYLLRKQGLEDFDNYWHSLD